MSVLGTTKIDEALGGIQGLLDSLGSRKDDVRINDVGIVLDVSFDHQGRSHATTGVLYSCSDLRDWVQSALFERASHAVYEDEEDFSDQGE